MMHPCFLAAIFTTRNFASNEVVQKCTSAKALFTRKCVRFCVSLSANDSSKSALIRAIKSAPTSPGVYLFKSFPHSRPLYVGKAKNIRARLLSHLKASETNAKTHALFSQATDIEFILTSSETAALILESRIIRSQLPRFNVLLKHAPALPYIKVAHSEKYPKLSLERSRAIIAEKEHVKDVYYGPFKDVPAARKLLNLLTETCGLRVRNVPLFRDRTCLNYDMKRCPGVCQELISPEDYKARVVRAERVLQGKVHHVVRDLVSSMKNAADMHEFELAAKLRDQATALRSAVESAASAHSVASSDPDLCVDLVATAFSEVQGSVLFETTDVRDITTVIVVNIVQVREGCVVNRFVHQAEVPYEDGTELEIAVYQILVDHYAALEGNGGYSVPNTIALNVAPSDSELGILSDLIQKESGSVDTAVSEFGLQFLRLSVNGRISPSNLTQMDEDDAFSEVDPQLRSLFQMALKNSVFQLQQRTRCRNQTDVRLEQLKDLLEKSYPNEYTSGRIPDWRKALERIECYDISHTSGTFAVASRVVFVNGIPTKSLYRKYNVDESCSIGCPDDYESMRTVLRRRLSAEKGRDQWPGLIVVDGGKGQLKAALDICAELDISVPSDLALLALAKREEEVFSPEQQIPIDYTGLEHGVLLLRNMRDEAHRVAVGAHRRRRSKGAFKTEQSSILDNVPGLGKNRQALILKHFGNSLSRLQKASKSELLEIPGIGDAFAERILIKIGSSDDKNNI